MAQFRGSIFNRGARSASHRLGHKTTGLVTECNGWTHGVRVEAYADPNGDRFEIFATSGSSPTGREVHVATLKNGEWTTHLFGTTVHELIAK